MRERSGNESAASQSEHDLRSLGSRSAAAKRARARFSPLRLGTTTTTTMTRMTRKMRTTRTKTKTKTTTNRGVTRFDRDLSRSFRLADEPY